ncbi:hypothetical protein [uncultured Lacinutrix sp.]|uniref:hypothetical protein n=1 Tax=uncultured Lacinutrix sp. TaxID=574032 RepID=UPI002615864C|nr:hypothetical protein [uncultured Lacinutrix sp.]
MSIEVPIIILIIAIPTYFIVKWLLKRFIVDIKTLKITSIVGTAILAPFIYIGFILIFMSYLFYQPQYEFNKNKWMASKHLRHEMRDDIVESRILNGKNKSEIVELIGESKNNDSLDIWVYDLGMSSAGFGWQFNSLELSFENGQVMNVKKTEIVH